MTTASLSEEQMNAASAVARVAIETLEKALGLSAQDVLPVLAKAATKVVKDLKVERRAVAAEAEKREKEASAEASSLQDFAGSEFLTDLPPAKTEWKAIRDIGNRALSWSGERPRSKTQQLFPRVVAREVFPTKIQDTALGDLMREWSAVTSGKGQPPLLSEIDPDAHLSLPTWVSLVDVAENGRAFRNRTIGRENAGFYPDIPAGASHTDVAMNDLNARSHSLFATVHAFKAPLLSLERWSAEEMGGDTVALARLILPIRTNKDPVGRIMIACAWDDGEMPIDGQLDSSATLVDEQLFSRE